MSALASCGHNAVDAWSRVVPLGVSEREGMVRKQRAKRRPWNKGREVGKKGAFTPAQVKRIRQVLLARGVPGLRDLALFQAAIDTMLHGPDLFNLTVKDV